MYKKRIGIIFGGRSGEHQVSLKSAFAVAKHLDSDKFVPVYIGITKNGEWRLFNGDLLLIKENRWITSSEAVSAADIKELIDFALPVLHGPYGEDGKIQGFFETLDIPYGGCGVLSSALCMDKLIFKDIMKKNILPVCRHKGFDVQMEGIESISESAESEIGFPCFVKPANMGSSIGITKAGDKESLKEAVRNASLYDRRIIIEEYIPCRELEVGVLGNSLAVTTPAGEIINHDDFYDYNAKYEKQDSPAVLKTPAQISDEEQKKIQHLAVRAYRAADCSGFARVDFFKDIVTGRIYLNEINTIPGFTEKSMFPLLWQSCGVRFHEMIERIIKLGYERHYTENNRKTEL